MYIRTVTFTYDPAQEEKVARIGTEQMVPTLQQLPGFVSYTSGFDRAAHRGISVTIWDSLEHLADARTAQGVIVKQFEAVGIRSDQEQVYELVRQV